VAMATSWRTSVYFYLHGDPRALDEPHVVPSDQSPTSHVAYLSEKVERLNAR
jgi:hypothetical protein